MTWDMGSQGAARLVVLIGATKLGKNLRGDCIGGGAGPRLNPPGSSLCRA